MSDTAIFERPSGPSPRPWRNKPPGQRDGSGPCPPPARAQSLPPAIRIPVTPQNRHALRSLRAQEMEAWQKAEGRARDHETSYLQAPPPDREAAVIFLLLGATAAALLLQTTAAATLLVTHWDRVESLVEALTR